MNQSPIWQMIMVSLVATIVIVLISVIVFRQGWVMDYGDQKQSTSPPIDHRQLFVTNITISLVIMMFAIFLFLSVNRELFFGPISVNPPPATNTASEITPATRLVYHVRVQEEGLLNPIANSRIIIEVEGEPPLIGTTDSNGLSVMIVESALADKEGRLFVEAAGYELYVQDVELTEEGLPDLVLLEPEPLQIRRINLTQPSHNRDHVTVTVTRVEWLHNGRMRWNFLFSNDSGEDLTLWLNYPDIHLIDEFGNRYPMLRDHVGTQPEGEFRVDLPHEERLDNWIEFPAPKDGARQFTVVLSAAHPTNFVNFEPFVVTWPE